MLDNGNRANCILNLTHGHLETAVSHESTGCYIYSILVHKTAAAHGEILLGISPRLHTFMRLFISAKESMHMPTGPETSIFVGVRGQQMDNSTLAKIVVQEMSAALFLRILFLP